MTAATDTATTAAPGVAKSYLSVNNIEVIYDHVILVLKGVSLEVPQGRIAALLGANGAGKTTTLKAISNLLRAERGDVTKGTIEFKGRRVDRLTPNELVKLGICQVMEGRHCFPPLTVDANRRGDIRDRSRPEPEGESELPSRGAEHERRAALRRLWLHPRERPRCDGRGGGRPGTERGRQGVLSRSLDGGTQIVSRREALS